MQGEVPVVEGSEVLQQVHAVTSAEKVQQPEAPVVGGNEAQLESGQVAITIPVTTAPSPGNSFIVNDNNNYCCSCIIGSQTE